MNDQAPYPDDEPVIGLETSAPGRRAGNPFARRRAPLPPIDADDYDTEDLYPDGEDILIGEDAERIYGNYYAASPARQPLFYVLLTIAAAIGAAAIFFIVREFSDGDGGTSDGGPAGAIVLQIALASPSDGDRLNAGEEIEFVARASSTGVISRFELIIDDRLATQAVAEELPPLEGSSATPARVFGATLRSTFDRRGDHQVRVRAVAGDNVKESSRIFVVVVEAPREVRVLGRVLATTALRTGPGDHFAEVGTLQAGTDVRLLARASSGQWLLIEDRVAGERWVRANAIQVEGDVESLPIRDTAATSTPGGAVSATATPDRGTTPVPSGLPDFVPTDARFVFSGASRLALRVTIRNDGASYNGPVVVSVNTAPGATVSSQLTFQLSLASGRSAVADFDVPTAPPGRVDITVRVDPANSIRESNDDNNSATFRSVASPAEPPDIQVAVTIQPGANGSIVVTVSNSGGPLQSTEVRVVLRVAGQEQTAAKTVSLGKDESTTFTFAKFAQGDGSVQVSLNGVPAASGGFKVEGASGTVSATAQPTGTTPAATATTPATTTATPQPTATRTPTP